MFLFLNFSLSPLSLMFGEERKALLGTVPGKGVLPQIDYCVEVCAFVQLKECCFQVSQTIYLFQFKCTKTNHILAACCI